MKNFLQKQKTKLEEEKKGLEKQLKSFAQQDLHIKGDWKTRFPDFGPKTADLEEETDQIEEYEATLPVEHTLEIELRKVNAALERIQNNSYGACQNCGKKIDIEKLKVNPEASFCNKCTEKEGSKNK